MNYRQNEASKRYIAHAHKKRPNMRVEEEGYNFVKK